MGWCTSIGRRILLSTSLISTGEGLFSQFARASHFYPACQSCLPHLTVNKRRCTSLGMFLRGGKVLRQWQTLHLELYPKQTELFVILKYLSMYPCKLFVVAAPRWSLTHQTIDDAYYITSGSASRLTLRMQLHSADNWSINAGA